MRSLCLPPVWTALALLGGCVDKTPFAVVKNTCVTDADCAEIGTVCDTRHQQCKRETVEEPYPVILQVRPKPGSVELPEGESLVEQETYPTFELHDEIPDNPLEVPLSQQVTGKVVRLVDGEETPVEAELTFLPEAPEDGALPLSAPTKVETRALAGDEKSNVQVSLNPNVRYRVHVQPLYEHSRELAPFTDTELFTADGTSALRVVAPAMARRTGVLRYDRMDDRAPTLDGHRIRLEDELSGAILSSTATTGEKGEFELYVPDTVMAGGSFNVVVSLKGFSLWRVKIAVDGSRLIPPDVVLTIPRPPALVKYQGGVEAKTSRGKGAPAPYANLIFSTRFPLPSDGQAPRGKDWCAWRSAGLGPAPLCSAHVATTSDASGKFSVDLLPGDYDVFIAPSSDSANSTALSTIKWGANVLSQSEEDPAGGARFELGEAIHFDGLVRSPRGEPMPNVRVTARPLGIPGETSEEEVYKYARLAAAITARRGTFELDVDRGYFDLTVEPPSESGFAWVHSLNRVVRGKPERPVGPLEPRAPVPVSGHVQHEGTPLPGATVEAFALITGDPGGKRAVRIAQTVTNDEGYYRLALPPAVRAHDPEEDAGVDAEAGADHSE